MLLLTGSNARQEHLGLSHGDRVQIRRLCRSPIRRVYRLHFEFIFRRRLGRRGRWCPSGPCHHLRNARDLALPTHVLEVVQELARTLIWICFLLYVKDHVLLDSIVNSIKYINFKQEHQSERDCFTTNKQKHFFFSNNVFICSSCDPR